MKGDYIPFTLKNGLYEMQMEPVEHLGRAREMMVPAQEEEAPPPLDACTWTFAIERGPSEAMWSASHSLFVLSYVYDHDR